MLESWDLLTGSEHHLRHPSVRATPPRLCQRGYSSRFCQPASPRLGTTMMKPLCLCLCQSPQLSVLPIRDKSCSDNRVFLVVYLHLTCNAFAGRATLTTPYLKAPLDDVATLARVCNVDLTKRDEEQDSSHFKQYKGIHLNQRHLQKAVHLISHQVRVGHINVR